MKSMNLNSKIHMIFPMQRKTWSRQVKMFNTRTCSNRGPFPPHPLSLGAGLLNPKMIHRKLSTEKGMYHSNQDRRQVRLLIWKRKKFERVSKNHPTNKKDGLIVQKGNKKTIIVSILQKIMNLMIFNPGKIEQVIYLSRRNRKNERVNWEILD